MVLVYILANIALPLYYWKHERALFNWFRHLLIPFIGIIGLALPVWGYFAPGQPAPYDYFGWIFLAVLIVSMIWGGYIMRARPEASARPGTIVADG